MKYYDLAKEAFEQIISDTGRHGDQRANGELGLALLLKAQAADMQREVIGLRREGRDTLIPQRGETLRVGDAVLVLAEGG